jgi:hypothetical protein
MKKPILRVVLSPDKLGSPIAKAMKSRDGRSQLANGGVVVLARRVSAAAAAKGEIAGGGS